MTVATVTPKSKRTQDEIVARIESTTGRDDLFGFAREVLLDGLDFEHARPYLVDTCTAQQWSEALAANHDADVEAQARSYLVFAISKILGHRGISASRSVQKLTEYAWLLGRDDVVEAMGAEDYAQYGAPQVRAFAVGMGWPFVAESPSEQTELDRMAEGLLCDPQGCYGGCG